MKAKKRPVCYRCHGTGEIKLPISGPVPCPYCRPKPSPPRPSPVGTAPLTMR